MVSFDLVPLTPHALRQIVDGVPVRLPGIKIADGALPPAHVARRSLALLAAGCPPQWAIPFNVVELESGIVVGGCGFKGAPDAGTVEIGYGIAAAFQRRGFASAAVARLLEQAAASGALSEVIAHIAPDNRASIAVVSRCGFARGALVLDQDDEEVVRWHWRVAGTAAPISA